MISIRQKWALVIAAALFVGGSCSKIDTQPMQALLEKLSHGPEAELPSMLYGYKESSPGAQNVLMGMLKPLRPPTPGQHMTLHNFRRAGRFTMIVARVPWHKGPYAYEYQPIIFCREGEQDQVVGYILPFNDILPLIKGNDMETISGLGQWYLQEYGSRAGTVP